MHRHARKSGQFVKRVTIESTSGPWHTIVVTQYTSGQQRSYGDSVYSGTIECADYPLSEAHARNLGAVHIHKYTQLKNAQTDWAGYTLDMEDLNGDGSCWYYEVVQVWLD
jgi:hypothetical protein